MAWPVPEILDDLLDALHGSDAFAAVSFGEPLGDADLPAASLTCNAAEPMAADDSPDSRWMRLSVTVRVRTRCDELLPGVRHSAALCDVASAALLADPYRGGRCRNLPVGRATEVGRWQLSRTVKRPNVEMSFDVRCHFELTEGE